MGSTDRSSPSSPIEADGIDETDGFEGDIESMGEEDEPPDTQLNVNGDEGRDTEDAQPAKTTRPSHHIPSKAPEEAL